MTHKEYKQQAKYQEEYMRQVKCYPCNKPNIMTHEECIKTSQVLRGIHGASKVLHMQKTKGHDLWWIHGTSQVSWLTRNAWNKSSVKMNACNKPNVTCATNQVSWLVGNARNKPSVKRNTCSKSSVTHAINQVSGLIRNACSKPSGKMNKRNNQVLPMQYPNVMRNACNNSIVINAVNQVSRGLHATRQMLFMQ